MSKDKMKKIKEAAILDANNDYYDPDTNNNTGKNKIVVMRGNTPVAVSQNSESEVTNDEQEKKEIDRMIDDNTTVKVTKLPDMLGEYEDSSSEEKTIETKKIIKENKIVKRIEASELTSEVKKKRGRPKKV